MTTTHTPRIYVGTYAKYNAGSIGGAWLELADYSDVEEFTAACLELHSDETDPELMFQDYENVPKTLYDDLPDIFEYLDFCKSSYLDQDVIDAGLYLGIALDNLEEAYAGQYDSDSDFAQEMAEETGAVDDNASWPHTCIDWEWAARELMYDYHEHNHYYFRAM
jgi:antirestriction protein